MLDSGIATPQAAEWAIGLDQSLGDADRTLIFGTVALDLERDSALWEGRELWAATEAGALAQHADLTQRLSAPELCAAARPPAPNGTVLPFRPGEKPAM